MYCPDKLYEIHQEYVLVPQKRILPRNNFSPFWASFYIQKCIKLSRIFLNRILALFRSHAVDKRIQLTGEFYQDLDWFLKFLPYFNGVTYISKKLIDES